MGPLAGRVILVVGASRGLGARVAPRLAAMGAHLVLVARTQGGLEETDDRVREAGGAATLLPLDITDFDAVDRLGPSVYQRFGRLDGLLVTAARLGRLMPVAQADPEWFQDLLRVHVLAAQHLIRTADPLLRRAEAGRAVFCTCRIAAQPRAYFGHIAAAKAALEALVEAYAQEVRKTPMRVHLFDPGPMESRFRRDAFPGEPPGRMPSPERAAARLAELFHEDAPLRVGVDADPAPERVL